MKLFHWFSILFCLIAFNAGAQKWLWGIQATGKSQNYGGGVPLVATDKYGNVYMAGGFNDTLIFGSYIIHDYPVYNNIYLIKYNSSGALQWIRQPRFSKIAEAYINGITTDTAGNIFITGAFDDTLYFGAYTLYCNSWGHI